MACPEWMGGVGHLKFLGHAKRGVVESQFLREYGTVVRIKGSLLVGQARFGWPQS